MVFEDRILVNPRLLRLKNPQTNEVIDWEIQDLEPEEVVQEGTEINAQVMNEIQTTVVDGLNSTSQTDALSANQGKVLDSKITTINNKFVYSSTETVIGTYMDKLLYRKTITTTAPQGGSSNYGIPHGISNLKAIIHQEINCTNNQGNTYPQHNDIYNFYIKDTDAQNVWCNVSSALYNWTLIVVLEYTKTTD